jgi:glycosyltransferase involved in cell wall biosynthesis
MPADPAPTGRHPDIKVSVVVITYNHERYIAQALDSVLEQRTPFAIEVIVSEDCSTDSTRAVIRDYQDRYPGRLETLLSDHNVNDNTVVSRAIAAARGEYVALLDGDDWWSSTEKLARQVAVLDADQAASLCFHNVRVVYEEGSIEPHPYHLDDPIHRLSKGTPKPRSGLEDIIGGNFIQTCSVMFRASCLATIPDWYAGLAVGDWPLYVLLAEAGHIRYLDDVLGVYRVHSHGQWSARLSTNRDVGDIEGLLETYAVLDRHLSFRWHDVVQRDSSYLHRAAAVALLRQRRVLPALAHWTAYVRATGPRAGLADRALRVSRRATRLLQADRSSGSQARP